MVEHLTADQEVIGSIPIVPLFFEFLIKYMKYKYRKIKIFEIRRFLIIFYQNDIVDIVVKNKI